MSSSESLAAKSEGGAYESEILKKSGAGSFNIDRNMPGSNGVGAVDAKNSRRDHKRHPSDPNDHRRYGGPNSRTRCQRAVDPGGEQNRRQRPLSSPSPEHN